jgi:3-oxoadipate enol-lactonase
MAVQHEASVSQAARQQTQQEYEQTVSSGGISYLEAGRPEAPPLVFLHGIGGAARMFRGQLDHFAGDYRAIAWDMPGYGNSTPLPLVSMDALAAALAGFIEELGLDRPVLVGHSLGGMVAQCLLARAPHTARAVVLAQTSAAFGSRDPAWQAEFLSARLGPLDAGRSMAALAESLVADMAGPDADPEGMALARDCLAHTPDSTYRDSVMAMPGFDCRDALARIAVPALVLAGTLDTAAPAHGMQRMAARIPGAQYVALEGVGHLAHLEQPRAFNAAVGQFLRGFPGGPAPRR